MPQCRVIVAKIKTSTAVVAEVALKSALPIFARIKPC